MYSRLYQALHGGSGGSFELGRCVGGRCKQTQICETLGMKEPVFILGGAQSDFARSWVREGIDVSGAVAEVLPNAFADARLDASAIDVIHVGNAFGQLFNGQGHLGAMPATVVDELWGVPASRHEAACASGGIAILAAMADIESGRYDTALVLGVEQERNVRGDDAARFLGAAAWVGHEAEGVTHVWPTMFDELADEYDRRYGIDATHLSAIAELNFRNARTNPNAQTREWKFNDASFTADDHANPVVAGRIRRNDCSQITDGAAAIVLAGRSAAEQWARERNIDLDTVPRVLGWGHRTVGLPIAAKLARSVGADVIAPHVRDAITDAFTRAGVANVDGVDAIETHDCFTPSEYMAIDHFGITAPGESWKAIESGELERDGRIPVNPSGGLIGGGHPVGCTGVRMVLDAQRQTTNQAGDYQVRAARRVATLNIGGSTATTVTFVVGFDD